MLRHHQHPLNPSTSRLAACFTLRHHQHPLIAASAASLSSSTPFNLQARNRQNHLAASPSSSEPLNLQAGNLLHVAMSPASSKPFNLQAGNLLLLHHRHPPNPSTCRLATCFMLRQHPLNPSCFMLWHHQHPLNPSTRLATCFMLRRHQPPLNPTCRLATCCCCITVILSTLQPAGWQPASCCGFTSIL